MNRRQAFSFGVIPLALPVLGFLNSSNTNNLPVAKFSGDILDVDFVKSIFSNVPYTCNVFPPWKAVLKIKKLKFGLRKKMLLFI